MEWINSSDSHILEPEDLFEGALGAKYPDECPRYVDEYQGVAAKFYYTGYEYVRIDEIVEGDDSEEGQALQEEMIRASKDPYERLKCLDKDGVWAEILNSTWMLYTMRAPNDDMVRDCCQVYNDWIAEHCSADPRRLYGTAMVHMQDPDWAAAELERVRKRGLKSVLINCDTRPEWPLYQESHYDRFWAAAQDLEMPVTLHIITGNVKDLFTFHGDERKKVPGATYQPAAGMHLGAEQRVHLRRHHGPASRRSRSCAPNSRSHGCPIGCSASARCARRWGRRWASASRTTRSTRTCRASSTAWSTTAPGICASATCR